MKRISLSIIVLLSVTSFFSCNDNKTTKILNGNTIFSVSEFTALTNYKPELKDSIKTIELDYLNSMDNGFIIPSERQVQGGYFTFTFSIRNNTNSPQAFAYKIYYQNESYKWPELDSLSNKEHELISENFYGSWEDSSILFKETSLIKADGEFHTIIDSIRILGNPRNETLCYENGKNLRWRRNPRVGNYSFLLAVIPNDTSSINSIPDHIKNICLQNDGRYHSPYYYFRHGDAKKLPTLMSLQSPVTLKVIARPDLGAGIHIDDGHFTDEEVKSASTNLCGNDPDLYSKAAFSQFIHYIDKSTNLENIPVIKDVLREGYSKREYNWNRSFYSREELISTTPQTANLPCQTVYSDPVAKKIVIKNPGTVPGKWRKENVGIISRNGLAYGKIRVKAKLTELLNKDNMWNGLTNAIWLINQGGGDGLWNLRRPCRKEGYMATYWGGREDKRAERVGYSEIDFEILKTPSYCPEQEFPPVLKIPMANRLDEKSWNVPWAEEITRHDAEITVACTNWDMACWEPKDYGVGCIPVTYQGHTFEAHRWDHWYRALTEKTYAADDSLFASDYYYFEIDWRPNEIIWRIGPEPESLRVVGYMNDKVTSIPNNQMLLIITQEFHNTKWWPGSPYQQHNIPFPLNDIFGEIYEVVIQ
ncbi:MAG TPA: hypothetical protein PKJ62_07060 [Bacteroidia bacterium]|nr:hypothetical protein [Bacteroidia bacterium]